MVFDVARHKFSEGLFTLLLFALASMVVAMVDGEVVLVEHSAPLRALIDRLTLGYPVGTALLLFPVLVYAALRLARSTVRVGIYSASSMGVIALSAVAMFVSVSSTNYLYMAVVVLLMSELLGRLVYCFGAKVSVGFLFTAMLSVGVMPLVDNALIPLSFVVPLTVVFLRGTLRETIITIFGVLLPTLMYCYVVWLLGGNFGVTFLDIWSNDVALQHEAVLCYLTVPRLIFLGVLFFLYICSVIFYFKVRVTMMDYVRSFWVLLMVLQLLLIVMLVVMPTASPAIVVAMMLIMTMVLPQFFISVNVPTAMIAYIALIISSIVTIF